MLALIRMDWTLGRGYALRLSPLFAIWLSACLFASKGPGGLLFAAFLFGCAFIFVPLFPFLAPTTLEPYLFALPVSRGQIVAARYLSGLMGVLAGILLPVGAALAARAAGIGQVAPVTAELCRGLALQALILTAGLCLFLPFHFRFGGDRGLAAFGGSALACLGLLLARFGWRGLADHVLHGAEAFLNGGAPLAGFLGLLLLGAASLALSIRAYRGRASGRPLPAFAPSLLFLPVLVLGVLGARSPLPLQAPPATLESLEALASPCFEADQPGAAVLVVRQGRTLLRRGYGLAEAGGPLKPGDSFRIGSLAQPFTAVLVLRRVEAGRMDLARPIRAYVPEAPAAWGAVTVEQCLRHTGGLPGEVGATGGDPARDCEPGTGYRLLALALERVTGKPFARLLEEELCLPLGLRHTRAGAGSVPGCMVSTVDDLAAWTLALHGGRVLSPRSLARMLEPGRTLGHDQGRLACALVADPAEGAVAVVLSSADRPRVGPDTLARRLLASACGRSATLP